MVAVDIPLDQGDPFDGSIIQIAPVDEWADARLERCCYAGAARDRARFDQCGAFPFAAVDVVVLAEKSQRRRDQTAGAHGAQIQIDAKPESVCCFGTKGRTHLPGQAIVKLAGGDRPFRGGGQIAIGQAHPARPILLGRLVGIDGETGMVRDGAARRVLAVVDEDQIHIRGIIQLAAPQLSHTDHGPGRQSTPGARSTLRAHSTSDTYRQSLFPRLPREAVGVGHANHSLREPGDLGTDLRSLDRPQQMLGRKAQVIGVLPAAQGALQCLRLQIGDRLGRRMVGHGQQRGRVIQPGKHAGLQMARVGGQVADQEGGRIGQPHQGPLGSRLVHRCEGHLVAGQALQQSFQERYRFAGMRQRADLRRHRSEMRTGQAETGCPCIFQIAHFAGLPDCL